MDDLEIGAISSEQRIGGLMDYCKAPRAQRRGKARFYSSYLNRFIQPDTIIPSPGNPQAFNRYSYVMNRPVNFNDPSGHCPEENRGCRNEQHKIMSKNYGWGNNGGGGGGGNGGDGGDKTNNPVDQIFETIDGIESPLARTIAKVATLYYLYAWKIDAWLYNNNVPTTFGIYLPEVTISLPGIFTFEGGGVVIFNWRSFEMDGYITGGAGLTGAIPPEGGGAVNILLLSTTGSSSNSSWEGPYMSVSVQGYAPEGVVAGQSFGTNGWSGFVDAAQNNNASRFFFYDPQSGKPIITNFAGGGVGSPGASLSLTFGNTFVKFPVFDYDLSVPIILPNNPYLYKP